MPGGVGAASRGRDPHLGEPLPLSNPRGSRGLDREPPGSRIPSGPSRALLHLPEGPDQGVGPANRCTDHARTITGAHHEVVPDRHPNLLFCFVAPSPECRVPKGCTCRLPQPSERSGHEVGRPPSHRGPGHHRGCHLDHSQHPPRWPWLSSDPATLHQPRELSDCRAAGQEVQMRSAPAMPRGAPGLPCGQWCCQCHWTQDLPGRQDAHEQCQGQRGPGTEHRPGEWGKWRPHRGPRLRHVGGRCQRPAEVHPTTSRGHPGVCGFLRRPSHQDE